MIVAHRRKSSIITFALLLSSAIATISPAMAAAEQSGNAPPPDAPPAATASGRHSYPAESFARFSPKSALDMLGNVPGFQIRGDDDGRRGLGQASENVLVNGQRLAAKSDTLRDQLGRIPASTVVRIDIVDGATLSIPGLSGQVADIITRPDKFRGQFNWRGEVRPHYSHLGYLGGDVSVKGQLGQIEYTAAIANDSGRGAFGGDYRILAADGSLREARTGRLWSDYDAPKLSTGIKWDGPGTTEANINASYRRTYSSYEEAELRSPVNGVPLTRVLGGRERGYDYELGGDLAFDVIGARLKLIALDRFNHNTYADQVILTPSSGSAPFGGRYSQIVDSGEVIGRAELGGKWGKADWQIATEAAFNRLDKVASLFDLAPDGRFVPVDFPGGNGGVREDRYEAMVSYGRPLSSKLRLQVTAGAENSTISQTGANTLSRTFTRPKGTLNLAWTPRKGTDVSLSVERAVGQLNFGDFLARAFIDNGNQNSNNAELVPTQSWNVVAAIKQDLGRWGTTNLRLFDRRFEDYIDVIPLPGGGEGRGNIDRARRHGIEWTSTVNLDPIGFRGAKLDTNLILQTSKLTDPLSGQRRQMAGLVDRQLSADLRHDIPGSDWAWGAGVEYSHFTPYYRLAEVGRESEGPLFTALFLENKDVFGKTVKLQVVNLANARHRLYRTVYDGPRTTAPVLFVEDRAQLIGPIFRLSVKGTF